MESRFQRDLIRQLRREFSGCIVLKNDPGYLQGVPDLIVLYRNRWAMLECKAHEDAATGPNQPYYVELLNKMSFAAFIYPENKDEVLHDLRLALRPGRAARAS